MYYHLLLLFISFYAYAADVASLDTPQTSAQIIYQNIEGIDCIVYTRGDITVTLPAEVLKKSTVLHDMITGCTDAIEDPQKAYIQAASWLLDDIDTTNLFLYGAILKVSEQEFERKLNNAHKDDSNNVLPINLDEMPIEQLIRLVDWANKFIIDSVQKKLFAFISKKPNIWEHFANTIHDIPLIHYLSEHIPITLLDDNQNIALVKLFNEVETDHKNTQYYNDFIANIVYLLKKERKDIGPAHFKLLNDIATVANEKVSQDIMAKISTDEIKESLYRVLPYQWLVKKKLKNRILDKDELDSNTQKIFFNIIEANKKRDTPIEKYFITDDIKINPVNGDEIIVHFACNHLKNNWHYESYWYNDKIYTIKIHSDNDMYILYNRKTNQTRLIACNMRPSTQDFFYSPDGKIIFIPSQNYIARLSNTDATPLFNRQRDAKEDFYLPVELNHDGTIIYNCYDHPDRHWINFINDGNTYGAIIQNPMEHIIYSPDGKMLLGYDSQNISLFKIPTLQNVLERAISFFSPKKLTPDLTIHHEFGSTKHYDITYNNNGSQFVVYNNHKYQIFDAYSLKLLQEGICQNQQIAYNLDNQLLFINRQDSLFNTFKHLSLLDYTILKQMRTDKHEKKIKVTELELLKKIAHISPLLLEKGHFISVKTDLIKKYIAQQLPIIIPHEAGFFDVNHKKLSKNGLISLLQATCYWQKEKKFPINHAHYDLLFANTAPITTLTKLFDTKLIEPSLDFYADKITNGAYLGNWAKNPIINTLYGKNNNGLLFLIIAYQRSWKYRKTHIVADQDAETFFNLQRDIRKEPSLKNLYNNPDFFDVSSISDDSCKAYIKTFITKKLCPSLIKPQMMAAIDSSPAKKLLLH